MSDALPPAAGLDADELRHLALEAMRENSDDDAIGYLQRGIALAPGDGALHYLLGAMHAHIKRYDRAIDAMAAAARLAPHIEMAHFQLGLLHFTSGDVDAAITAWSALDALDAQHPLSLFRAGLLHLTRDEFAACIEALQRGLALNQRYPALNHDMQRVIGKAEDALAASRTTPR